ncbi:hypothetical protein ACIFOT_13280 [Neobacillus sp. NRS-1170]|uniref:hypothetical protein n=1 Tax=Neobacillus sp. NRS-1170 TaxID=3233898 RepID=UPI003D2CBD30
MSEMFERFMGFKQSEGLAPRTIEEYQIHLQWLLDYLDGDLSSEEMTLDVFREWVDFMLNEKGLHPQRSLFKIDIYPYPIILIQNFDFSSSI